MLKRAKKIFRLICQYNCFDKKEQSDKISELSSIQTQEATLTYPELICPIEHTLMVDPVSIQCGHQFSRKALEQWLRDNKQCPLCKGSARAEDIRPVLGTKKTIERFREKMKKKGKQWIQERIQLDFGKEIEK